MSADKWRTLAQSAARDAHRNHFSSRRGIWYFEDMDVLVLYNNNPYEGFPAQREKELARLRAKLADEEIAELAYATYPSDGYTYAMVINAARDREEELARWMFDLSLESLREMDGNAPS